MLIAGNRSTGMRARLVTPITSNTRQMTTIRYGLRIENLGMTQPFAAAAQDAGVMVGSVTVLGVTVSPGCSRLPPLTTTRSPGWSPEVTSTAEGVSNPSVTVRVST